MILWRCVEQLPRRELECEVANDPFLGLSEPDNHDEDNHDDDDDDYGDDLMMIIRIMMMMLIMRTIMMMVVMMTRETQLGLFAEIIRTHSDYLISQRRDM